MAVQKARTAVFFSASTRAYSARAVGFLAQSLYPPGINNTRYDVGGSTMGSQTSFRSYGTSSQNWFNLDGIVTNLPVLEPVEPLPVVPPVGCGWVVPVAPNAVPGVVKLLSQLGSLL